MRTAKSDGVVRFTVSVPAALAKELDKMTGQKGYDNRSLAVADLIRAGLVEHYQNLGNKEIAGTITLVYDHHKQHVQATPTGFGGISRAGVAIDSGGKLLVTGCTSAIRV